MKFTYRVVVDTNKRQIRLYRAFGLLLAHTIDYRGRSLHAGMMVLAGYLEEDINRRDMPGLEELLDYLSREARKKKHET